MKSKEWAKGLVGKRVHHNKFGDGTIIGELYASTPYLFLVDFDKEDLSLHDGENDSPAEYGRCTGRLYHCWYFKDEEIVTMLKEDKKMGNTGKPKTSGDLMDFISFLRNDYKTSKKEGKIIADFLSRLEEGNVKSGYISEKDENGLQEVSTTSRCYPYLGGEMYQKDGGETTFTLPPDKYKSILRKLTNQEEVPEPTEEELRATVKLYYKDKWDEAVGRNEAVKKMEKRIKNEAARIINANYTEAIEKLDKRHKEMAGRIFNYTMGEEK